jgi:hypothetical protein
MTISWKGMPVANTIGPIGMLGRKRIVVNVVLGENDRKRKKFITLTLGA